MSESATKLEARLLNSIENRTARVGVIGLGYVGLPLSLVFSRAGFHVTGFDIDEKKIEALERDESYIKHIGNKSIASARASGRFAVTADFSVLTGQDAILICVPTPLTPKREPDLSLVENTAREIALHLRPGQLIVLESSTYPGTTDEVVVPLLECSGLCCAAVSSGQEVAHLAASAGAADHAGAETSVSASVSDSWMPANAPAAALTATAVVIEGESMSASERRVFVAYSPEREDPGNKKFTTAQIPKLVGGVDAESGRLATALYSAAFEKVVQVSSARVAEMAKILENTYRCVNIALVNELKELCMRMDIDVCEVIDAAATKPFGFQAFYPGPGLGGHCIPIDPFYLSWKARQYDFTTRFIDLAGDINTAMPYKVVEYVAEALNHQAKAVNGSKIMVLGIAYKKDIDDLRESPAIKIIDLLRHRGAHVEYNDPLCPHLWKGRHNNFEMFSHRFRPQDAANYDCVIIATDHSVYDYAAIAQYAKLLIDTRNATRGINLPNVYRC